MKDVRSLIEEGIAADSWESPRYGAYDDSPLPEEPRMIGQEGPHAERYRQIQALLDEPVGEVKRCWVDHEGEGEIEMVYAPDYDSLLAKYNALLSEKASDLEAWEELAGLFSEGKGGQFGLLVSDWEPLVIYPDSHPLAYEKIKQAQLSGEGSGEGK